MQIVDFNTVKGFYKTKVFSIKTELHSHPAIEIIFCETGEFDLQISEKKYSRVCLAVIDSNCLHKISGDSVNMTIFIIENKDQSVKEILLKSGIKLTNGIYLESKSINQNKIESIINDIINNSDSKGYDARVLTAIDFMDTNDVTYLNLLTTLKNQTYISESRLSHLFKSNTGVSLKKYFVWSKLKKTVNAHLHKNLDLYSAMVLSGFYDQAHFSKCYKSMIGLNPSKVYNSRILQHHEKPLP